MTDVEKNTDQYFEIDETLPSSKIILEHARSQYESLSSSKQSIETKGSIALSVSLAMIALIISMRPESFPIISITFLFFGLVISIFSILPFWGKHPGPPSKDLYKYASYGNDKCIDLLLVNYVDILDDFKKKINIRGFSIWLAIIFNGLGVLSYIIIYV